MNEKNLDHLLQPICKIAVQAGSIINKYYKINKEVSFKEDKSPLTKADLESNKFIIQSLTELDSSIPVLTEESLIEWSVRKHWSQYWLVDPLDGTKEFINQNNEFTVNIALIENHHPVLGVIYAPAFSTLYYAYRNNGSHKLFIEKNLDSISGSIKIKTLRKKKTEHLRVFESRSHSNVEFQKWVNENIKDYELIKKGSSLKFCELAEGRVDLYPRFGPTSEWDIAAGHIILIESGGELESVDHEKILYNKKESVINPHFIASCNLNN